MAANLQDRSRVCLGFLMTLGTLTNLRNELGVQDPVGFWDPAGFTADGSVEDFKRRRQTEIKHGRIAMLAAMGYITPEQLGCMRSPSPMAESSTWAREGTQLGVRY